MSEIGWPQLAALIDDEKGRKEAESILEGLEKDEREFARRQEIPVAFDGMLSKVAQSRTVHYDNAQEQTKSAVTVKGGLLHRAGGELVDTAASSTYFSRTGVEIFVVSLTGEIHMGSHKIGKYHHSSLLGGASVAMGGEMKVNNGRIEWISNKSGHYLPNADQVIQFLHWLKKDGVELDFAIQGGWDIPDYPLAEAALQDGKKGATKYHTLKLSTVVKAHIEQVGRRKVSALLETLGFKFGLGTDEVVDSTGKSIQAS